MTSQEQDPSDTEVMGNFLENQVMPTAFMWGLNRSRMRTLMWINAEKQGIFLVLFL